MKLYRFSPITTKETLFETICHIHVSGYSLCYQVLGRYLENAGNMGIFCHYEEEFLRLKKIREELTFPSDNPNQKYFLLREPIVIPAIGEIPSTTYTHLYIRRPDPYRAHVGDVDFYLPLEEYQELKQSLVDGIKIEGARILDRKDLDMIELYHPDVDVLPYVSTDKMTQDVRMKLSDATKL